MDDVALKRQNRGISRPVAPILLALGMSCLTFGLWHTWQTGRCRSWPRVEATVSKLSITMRTNVAAHNKYHPAWLSERVDFSYRYTVDGRQYESSRFFYLPGYPDGSLLRERFSQGAHFQALRHPHDPSTSIVEPEAPSYFALITGLALLGAWGVALWVHRQGTSPGRANLSHQAAPEERLGSSRTSRARRGCAPRWP
jgi:hypothetical protein